MVGAVEGGSWDADCRAPRDYGHIGLPWVGGGRLGFGHLVDRMDSGILWTTGDSLLLGVGKV